jgi:Ser/Thr protein kinase RdoA (MazF antagonist)
VFQETAQRVQAGLEDLYGMSGPPRILHADLHQGNVRVDRGKMRVLDFDDCVDGHFVQDVGITFWYILAHPEYEALRDAYRAGYESRRPWPETSDGQLELVIAGRELLLCQFLFYTDNPRFKPVLPNFFARAEARLRAFNEKYPGGPGRPPR